MEALEEVLEAYRDMFGTKTERANNIHRLACEDVAKLEKMKAFIRGLFDEYYPDMGDIGGDVLQDLAEKHGILMPEIRHEPCGEFCNCAQVCSDEEFKEGAKCYRLANWLSAQQMRNPTKGSSRNNWTGLRALRGLRKSLNQTGKSASDV